MFTVPDMSARRDHRSESLEFETAEEVLMQIKLLTEALLAGGETLAAPPNKRARKKRAVIDDFLLLKIKNIIEKNPGIEYPELSEQTGIAESTLYNNKKIQTIIGFTRGSGKAYAGQRHAEKPKDK